MCVALAVGIAGCVQVPGNELGKPMASAAPATSAPLDLSAHPAATAAPAKSSVATKSDRLTPAGKPVKAAKPVPETVASTPKDKPAAAANPAEPAPAAAAFAPEPPPPQAMAVRPDGFPNINAPPAEPDQPLLTPEERAKVIGELEALRNRQGVAPQAPQKKAPPKKCTDLQIAAGDKDCKPPTN